MREEERAPTILLQGILHKEGVLSLFCHLEVILGFLLLICQQDAVQHCVN
ncbi:uncharacterized protein HKW66_Vig0043940 [Vigna angularis]|uniref:Uncharacterized protein n=1 Tax=Phaseolus angularis TaxID=3914 RepID=A0A8T0L0A4_PHAAN|nr:uncharacterized protein HKW66_Vig0043940 [Vigna angularis]